MIRQQAPAEARTPAPAAAPAPAVLGDLLQLVEGQPCFRLVGEGSDGERQILSSLSVRPVRLSDACMC